MNNRLIIVDNKPVNHRLVFPVGNVLADEFAGIQK